MEGRFVRGIMFSAILLVALGHAAAQAVSAQALLEETFKGKTLVLRHFYSDEKLTYDQNGQPAGKATIGPHALASVVVDKIEGEKDGFTLSGRRVDTFHPFIKVGKVELRVKGLGKTVTREDVEKLRDAIFYKSEDDMQPDLPAYWRHSKYGKGPFTYEGEQPLELSDDIVPPKAVYKPHAKYPKAAGEAQFGGHSEISAVVNPDGTVRDVRIEKAVGLGFDDAAAQALERWRFQPGTRNGKPVAVLVHMEFSYSIE